MMYFNFVNYVFLLLVTVVRVFLFAKLGQISKHEGLDIELRDKMTLFANGVLAFINVRAVHAAVRLHGRQPGRITFHHPFECVQSTQTLLGDSLPGERADEVEA